MKKIEKKKIRKGVYILPNLFTTFNIFLGFFAIVHVIKGDFAKAAWAIVFAGLFDGLDGKIARATNTTSKFGVEYDSLADLVSFGVAPALLIYMWALQPLGRLGWVAGFLFMVCGALRLARFNTHVGSVSGEYFVGLPIPAGAGMSAAIVLFSAQLNLDHGKYPFLILVVLYILSFLMVSTIRYNSFKKPELFKRISLNALVGVILVMTLVIWQPEILLFCIGLVYVVSGPVAAVRMNRARLKHSGESTPNAHEEPEKHGIGRI